MRSGSPQARADVVGRVSTVVPGRLTWIRHRSRPSRAGHARFPHRGLIVAFRGRPPFVPPDRRRSRSPTARRPPRWPRAPSRLSGHRPAKMLSTARPRRYWRSGAHWVTPFLRSHVAPRPAVAAVVRTVQSSRRCRGRPPCAPRERRRSLSRRSRCATRTGPSCAPRSAPAPAAGRHACRASGGGRGRQRHGDRHGGRGRRRGFPAGARRSAWASAPELIIVRVARIPLGASQNWTYGAASADALPEVGEFRCRVSAGLPRPI